MEQLSRRTALLAGIAGAAAVASPAFAPGAALAQAGLPAATVPGIELRRIRVGDIVLNGLGVGGAGLLGEVGEQCAHPAAVGLVAAARQA